eukprot:scaffold23957_cov63-Phaeocystis_antarctica.AAC.2
MEVAEEAAGRRHRSALLIFRSSESWTRSERDGVEGDGDMAGGSTPGRPPPPTRPAAGDWGSSGAPTRAVAGDWGSSGAASAPVCAHGNAALEGEDEPREPPMTASSVSAGGSAAVSAATGSAETSDATSRESELLPASPRGFAAPQLPAASKAAPSTTVWAEAPLCCSTHRSLCRSHITSCPSISSFANRSRCRLTRPAASRYAYLRVERTRKQLSVSVSTLMLDTGSWEYVALTMLRSRAAALERANTRVQRGRKQTGRQRTRRGRG